MKKIFSILFVSLICFCSGMNVSICSELLSFESDTPYCIFEGKNSVSFTLNASDGGNANIHIIDYYGNTQSFGSCLDGTKIEPENLDYGWYKIIAERGNYSTYKRFSVVPEKTNRRDSTKSPVAFASMASHTAGKRDNIDAYVNTISLAGVHYVREFCVADEIINSDGTYNYTPGRNDYTKLNTLMQAYKDNNIKVLMMFQNMPAFMCEEGNGLPNDLAGVYNFTKNLCEHYSGQIDAVEILNETDGGGSEPTDGEDLYAAVLKAAAIGAMDSGENVKILNGGFATNHELYHRKLIQNSISDYINVFSGHYYNDYDGNMSVAECPDDPYGYFSEKEKYGLTDKELWLTEYGFRIPYEENSIDLTDTQQRIQARTAPTSIIKAIASGSDKVFWFLHGYINEYNKCYGDMGSDFTPYMSYSALSAMTNALGNAEYRGKYDNLTEGINAYMFCDGSENVCAVWSQTEKNVTLFNADGIYKITDIMGNEQTISSGSAIALTIGPDIKYIRTSGELLIDSDMPDKKYNSEKVYNSLNLNAVKRIVMLPQFEAAARRNVKDNAYELSATTDNTVTVKVYNFNNITVSGEVSLYSSGGWVIENNNAEVTVPPNGSSEISFVVKGGDDVVYQNKTPLVFEGEFNVGTLSNAVSYIKTSEYARGVDITSSKGTWQEKATSSIISSGATVSKKVYNAGVSMTYDFSQSTGQKYHAVRYKETRNMNLDAYGAIALEFKADKAIGDFTPRLWICDNDGDVFYSHKPENLDKLSTLSINLSTTYRQVVFYLDRLTDTNSAGDGVLNLASVKYIDIGFMLGEKVNGITPPEGLINTDNFTLYLKNAVGLNCDVVQEDAPSILSIKYEGGRIKTEISTANIKAIKQCVGGVWYEAEKNGMTAENDVFLTKGEYNVITVIYDALNIPYVFENTISVKNSAVSSELVAFKEDAIYSAGIGKIIIKGNIENGLEDRVGTVTVFKVNVNNNGKAENITPSDVVYIDEIRIDRLGNYAFSYYADNLKDEYNYVINIDGTVTKGKLKSVETVYSWLDSKVGYVRKQNAISAWLKSYNHNESNADCEMLTCCYDFSNRLVNVYRFNPVLRPGENEQSALFPISDNVTSVKVFLWTKDGNIKPVCLSSDD